MSRYCDYIRQKSWNLRESWEMVMIWPPWFNSLELKTGQTWEGAFRLSAFASHDCVYRCQALPY